MTVTVSKGPSTSSVPDVTTQDVAIAQTTLEAAGFRTRVVLEDTDDQTVRRHRHLPGSGRRHAVQAEHARHALRRTLRQHHHDDPVSARVRVAVLAGGRSSEHDISVASARSVVEALDPERYETVVVEIDRAGRWELASGRDELPETSVETLPVVAGSPPAATLGQVDVVLPILHGPFGEDGTVQGLLELADVPYVGAGVAASALCMDKDLFKAVLRDRGIPVARNVTLRDGDVPEHPFTYPVFVKPARLGSSVGISKVHDESELDAAVELAREHDDKVLVEEGVPGRRGRVRRPRKPRPDRIRSSARSSRTPSGTTSPPSTTREAWTSSSRRGSPAMRTSAFASSPSSRSSRRSARAWPASTSSCGRTGRSS